MEVNREAVTEEKWAEMKQISKNNVCGECGGDLHIHTVPEEATIRIGCHNREHHGFIERLTYTQALRRGEEIHPSIRDNIERKMIPKDDLARAFNLLALRYPMAIKDPPTAALFIMDCARLDIDPLISPAEAVPIPFRSRHIIDGVEKVKVTIQMIITQDGWLSMAARGCQDDWVGPPRTMRLEEYLTTLPENKKRPREEILQIAQEIKESDCLDGKAWYYVAVGRRRNGDDTVVPGWFTHKDMEKAKSGRLPASEQPGNQAATRAIKKWVRKVFPECRQRMIALTAEWYERAEGIQEAQKYIDAEYAFISLPETEKKFGGVAEEKKGERGKATTTNLSSAKQVNKSLGESAAETGGEIPIIEPIWLEETLLALKWSHETAGSWLETQFNVDTQGGLWEIIPRISREQAKKFCQMLEKKLADMQGALS